MPFDGGKVSAPPGGVSRVPRRRGTLTKRVVGRLIDCRREFVRRVEIYVRARTPVFTVFPGGGHDRGGCTAVFHGRPVRQVQQHRVVVKSDIQQYTCVGTQWVIDETINKHVMRVRLLHGRYARNAIYHRSPVSPFRRRNCAREASRLPPGRRVRVRGSSGEFPSIGPWDPDRSSEPTARSAVSDRKEARVPFVRPRVDSAGSTGSNA